MRILHVVHYFLPTHVAGVEVYTFHLAREQAKRHTVSIFTREDGHFTAPIRAEDDRVGELPVRRVYFNRPLEFETLYRNREIDAEFGVALDRLRPDVVHFQHLDRLSAGMIELAAARGIATVLTLHDYWFICPQIQLLTDGMQPCTGPEGGARCARCGNVLAESIREAVLQRLAAGPVSRRGFSWILDRARALLPDAAQARLTAWWTRRALRRYVSIERSRARYQDLRDRFHRVDAVTAPSRFLIETFRAAGFDRRPIEYIDYGIPLPQRRPPLGTGERRPLRCGYLSTVVAHKGIEVALEAFRGIDPSQAELLVRSPGYPPYVAAVQRRAAGLPHVRFLGPYQQDQVGAVFAELDVLLVPSLWYENSPLIIHEAAAAGVPVIATDLGGMAEYVHEGKNGLLFRRGDSGHLRQRILELASEPELLRRLQQPPFPIKSIAENAAEFEALYRVVLRGRMPRPNTMELSG